MRQPSTEPTPVSGASAMNAPTIGDPRFYIAPEGWPFIAPFLVLAALLALFGAWRSAALALGFALAMAGFFRDPPRCVPQGGELVLSPADGTVVEVVEEREPLYLKEHVQRISIFLSVFNVHVNRSPIAAEVELSQPVAGKFLPAYKPQASQENVQYHLLLKSQAGPLLVKQIVGILARRIVCRVKAGAMLRAGQRFGLIRFGSRVDLFLPLNAQIIVQTRQRVRGGETILARLPSVTPRRDATRQPQAKCRRR